METSPLSLNLSLPTNIRYSLVGRRALTSEDVRSLVFESIGLISRAQDDLDLKICPNIQETKRRLREGTFEAKPLSNMREETYRMAFGSFSPPATIVLDSHLPFCDMPMDIPDVPSTMTRYTAVHEVIHADDHAGGDVTLHATREHFFRHHRDKLESGMEVIESADNGDCICNCEELANIWAIQYVNLLTHYRSYVVLRHHRLPRLDMVWDMMQNDFFPPNLLTQIEIERDMRYVFEKMIERAGEYCIIDALLESKRIRDKHVTRYAV